MSEDDPTKECRSVVVSMEYISKKELHKLRWTNTSLWIILSVFIIGFVLISVMAIYEEGKYNKEMLRCNNISKELAGYKEVKYGEDGTDTVFKMPFDNGLHPNQG